MLTVQGSRAQNNQRQHQTKPRVGEGGRMMALHFNARTLRPPLFAATVLDTTGGRV